MSLHREIRGEGPPLLLLHAGGLDGRMWDELAQRIEDRFTLVIPDLPAHGRTPLPPGLFATAEEVVALLDELGIERAAVVGNSYGGRVALQLAAIAPERVAALVLLASSLPEFERSPELKAFVDEENALWDAGDVDGLVELNVRTWVRDPAVAEFAAEMIRTACELQSGLKEDPERPVAVDLGAIAAPTLAVSAGRDFVDFARIADRVAAEVPGAQRADVPDAGHMIPLERPDETAELLVAFLERVGPY
jgi:3-oxoadipate enol-lactonase